MRTRLFCLLSLAAASNPSPLLAAGVLDHGALGASLAFEPRQEYGTSKFVRKIPELVFLGYRPLSGAYWLRPGLRLGASLSQPEMPESLQIREYDASLLAELGLTRDGTVIPSLALGAGTVYRHTKLVARGPIEVTDDPVSGGRFYPALRAQAGLGLPFARGAFVLEPYARYTRVFGDSRSDVGYGIEGTLSVF